MSEFPFIGKSSLMVEIVKRLDDVIDYSSQVERPEIVYIYK